jgi:hypothetical protein
VRGIDGFEGVILEDFLADFIPEILFWIEFRRVGGKNSSVMLSGTARSPQRWLGAPSRTKRISCLANLRDRTLRKHWKHAVFEVGMIR